jgi:adenylate cyclase class 2
MVKTEIEIKLRIEDTAAFATRLADLGARLTRPREFEDNRLFDFADRSLLRRGAILRLRSHGGRALLTYKEKPRVEGGAKVRDEIEVAFDEAPPLAAIVARLGMTPVFRYQKYRTSYSHGDLHITLDETPIGTYAEIEGPRDQIDSAAARLGFEPSDYIVESYRDLYLKSLEEASDKADSMLFTT